ncbi:unnamed protein product, partial [Iphiclides podalirius]
MSAGCSRRASSHVTSGLGWPSAWIGVASQRLSVNTYCDIILVKIVATCEEVIGDNGLYIFMACHLRARVLDI